MKLKWSESTMWSDDEEYDKAYIKNEENYLQSRLEIDGFLFLNEVLDSLGFAQIKRGQLDGWLWDPDDPAGQKAIKIKFKTDNGELYLHLNEEKDIINLAFLD